MSNDSLAQRAAAVRHFNRFYTRQIGVLARDYLDSPFSLTEARVIYELAHRGQASPGVLAAELALDTGYMSRIVRDFVKQELITRETDPRDGRQAILRLTERGRAAFAMLNERSQRDFEAMLATHSEASQARLLEAMRAIESILSPEAARPAPPVLRAPLAGDMGWVVSRHGALYAAEYGWNMEFEAMVAEIAAKFLRDFDPSRERAWIAERGGERVGSVLVIAQSRRVAKLRLLFVEPQARNSGLGRRLVAEAIRYSRAVGYRRLVLWTNDILHAARRLYEEAGFVLEREEPHHSFGTRLVGQYWALAL